MQTQQPRQPGELVFTIAMVLGSAILLWQAYGISGFEALSGPGTVPMVTSATMLICSTLILVQTLRKRGKTGEKLERDILPLPVIVTILAIIAYALVLKPLGFLPTSFLFLLGMIRYLAGRSLMASALLAAGIVLLIWLIFRLVFTVLMPPGIVPEAEIIAWFKALFTAGGN